MRQPFAFKREVFMLLSLNIGTLVDALPGACAQGLIWALMAIGVYITYRVMDIADLTVDGSLATGGAVCLTCIVAFDQPVWLAVIMGTLAGALCGLVTGILHTVMGIPPILAGILTQISLYSINLKILNSRSNASMGIRSDLLVTARDINKSLIVLGIIVLVVVVILYWFFGTEKGSSMRATGCNESMSKAQGINTNVNKIIGLMLSNALVGLAGAMLTQYQGFADINMGRGAIVIGLAAVIIGEAVFGRIFKNFAWQLVSVALGAIVYYIVLQFVIWLEIDTDLLKVLQAAVVAVFLAFPYWKKRYFTKVKTNSSKQGGEQ